jgi:Glutathionylspermidine synthase preATP-grasp
LPRASIITIKLIEDISVIIEWRENQEEVAALHQFLLEKKCIECDFGFIYTPLVFPIEEMINLSTDLRYLLNLFLKLPERMYRNNKKAFLKALAYEEPMLTEISRYHEILKSEVLCRFDLIYTNQGWKILELNIGSNTGMIHAAPMVREIMTRNGHCKEPNSQSIPLSDYIPGNQDKNNNSKNESISSQDYINFDTPKYVAKEIARQMKMIGNKYLALVEDDCCFSETKNQLITLANAIEAISAIKTLVLRSSELKVEDGNLTGRGFPISAIYSFFTLEDVLAKPNLYSPVMELLQSGRVQHIMGFAYAPIGNKLMMALIHQEKQSGNLTPEEEKLVNLYLPQTRKLSSELKQEILERRTSLVLKPADSYGGIGVLVGQDFSNTQWQESVESILQDNTSYVVQEFVVSDRQFFSFCDCEGTLSQSIVPYVLGVYLVGNEFAGGLIRASIKPTHVLNAHNGACVGTILAKV